MWVMRRLTSPDEGDDRDRGAAHGDGLRAPLSGGVMTEVAIAYGDESNTVLRISSPIGCRGHSGRRKWSRWSRRSMG